MNVTCIEMLSLRIPYLPFMLLMSSSLQALQYLRKLCNHPGLVLLPQHPEYKRITDQLAAQHSSLRDIQHSPKLSALKQVPLFPYTLPLGTTNSPFLTPVFLNPGPGIQRGAQASFFSALGA